MGGVKVRFSPTSIATTAVRAVALVFAELFPDAGGKLRPWSEVVSIMAAG